MKIFNCQVSKHRVSPRGNNIDRRSRGKYKDAITRHGMLFMFSFEYLLTCMATINSKDVNNAITKFYPMKMIFF